MGEEQFGPCCCSAALAKVGQQSEMEERENKRATLKVAERINKMQSGQLVLIRRGWRDLNPHAGP